MSILLKFVISASMLSLSMADFACGCTSGYYCSGSLTINNGIVSCSGACYCPLTQGVPFTVPSSLVASGSTVSYYVYLNPLQQTTLSSSIKLPSTGTTISSKLSPISSAASSTATTVPANFVDGSTTTQTIVTIRRVCSEAQDPYYLSQAAELLSFTYTSPVTLTASVQTGSTYPGCAVATVSPTAAATQPPSSFTCPYYSTANSDSATQNYAYCNFNAWGGTVLTFSGCGACTGDQFLSLYTSTNAQVAVADDGCTTGNNACTFFTYTVPGSSTTFNSFSLREGCYAQNACSGIVTVTGAVGGMTDSGTVGVTTITTAPSTWPTTAPTTSSATTSVPTSGGSSNSNFPVTVAGYSGTDCSGGADFVQVSNGACFPFSEVTDDDTIAQASARVQCASQGSSSSWTLVAYSTPDCAAASAIITMSGSDMCNCGYERYMGHSASVLVNCAGFAPSCSVITGGTGSTSGSGGSGGGAVSGGAIAGIIVGALALVAVVAAAVYYFHFMRKASAPMASKGAESEMTTSPAHNNL